MEDLLVGEGERLRTEGEVGAGKGTVTSPATPGVRLPSPRPARPAYIPRPALLPAEAGEMTLQVGETWTWGEGSRASGEGPPVSCAPPPQSCPPTRPPG